MAKPAYVWDGTIWQEMGMGTVAWPPDTPPASPSAYDYEFGETSSSIPSGWAWSNQGTATYTEQYGSGYLRVPSGTGAASLRVIDRAITADAAWTITAKFRRVSVPNTNYFHYGISLRDSASGKYFTWSWDLRFLQRYYFNSATSWNSETNFGHITLGDTVYLRLRKNSSTSYDMLASADGAMYHLCIGALNPTAWLTPTHMGWYASTDSSHPGGVMACDWWRYVPSAI